MPFYPPSWVPPLPQIPNVPLPEFMFNEQHGRLPFPSSRPPFVCGLTGKSYTVENVKQRVDFAARALTKILNWKVNGSSEWDKVVAIYSFNAIDYFTAAWAVLKLGGIVATVSAANPASQIAEQLRACGAKALFTCNDLVKTAEEACDKARVGRGCIFTLPLPEDDPSSSDLSPYLGIDELVSVGGTLQPLEPITWSAGESKRRVAFLLQSSGTAGRPKDVMMTHRNVMANALQCAGYESVDRAPVYTESCIDVAPMSHIFAVAAIANVSVYRGDSVVVLPRYNLETMLQTVERYKIALLYVVPPMIVDILRSPKLCQKYDLSSVRGVITAAAPIKRETCEQLANMFPNMALKQAYGSTEAAGGISLTSPSDIQLGTCGSLLAGNTLRIMTAEGKEVTEYGGRGELLVRGPAVVPGYLANDEANKETFAQFEDGVYLRTGDEGMIQLSPRGNEHIVITERLKELIKVKGLQVAPADLEALLLTHPSVDDVAVIGIHDEREGEIPKAFVVKSDKGKEKEAKALEQELFEFVEQHKARHMWLKGGIEFADSVPKSQYINAESTC